MTIYNNRNLPKIYTHNKFLYTKPKQAIISFSNKVRREIFETWWNFLFSNTEENDGKKISFRLNDDSKDQQQYSHWGVDLSHIANVGLVKFILFTFCSLRAILIHIVPSMCGVWATYKRAPYFTLYLFSHNKSANNSRVFMF